jgi:beta-galactosidase
VKEKQVPGQLSGDVIAAVKGGTPLLVAVPDDDLADGVARQLASLGAFSYEGQIGDTRAPWMGNWLFVKDHATFAGMPTDRVLGVHYQAPGKQSNGLLIERSQGGPEPTIIMGYSRDHDRKIGAASFICSVGEAPVLFHRAPAFNDPLQERWLRNALRYLTSKQVRA